MDQTPVDYRLLDLLEITFNCWFYIIYTDKYGYEKNKAFKMRLLKIVFIRSFPIFFVNRLS